MKIQDAQVVVLAENQYQELELWYPLLRLREAGANVFTVGPSAEQLYGSKLGYPVRAELAINEVKPEQLDAVVVPGGFAPENFRRTPAIIDLIRKVHEQGSLVAAICHAGWVLASAGIAKGKRLTCVPIIKDDVIHAGGNYVDEPVVRDGNLITSRLPGDLHLFCKEIIRYLEENPSRRKPDAAALRAVAGRARTTADYSKPARVVQTSAGRRLHHLRRHAEHAWHQRRRARQPAVRPDQGFLADRPDRHLAVPSDRASVRAGRLGEGADRARQVEAWRAELRVVRQRQHQSSRRRAL